MIECQGSVVRDYGAVRLSAAVNTRKTEASCESTMSVSRGL